MKYKLYLCGADEFAASSFATISKDDVEGQLKIGDSFWYQSKTWKVIDIC